MSSRSRWTAEDMLYTLYTSGTTGKPKGIIHTTGGYLVGCYATTKWVFDLKDDDVYWCTADIGWVTGHSYVVYGPLSNGATVMMYEGAPDWPQKDRFWSIIARYGVTIFYTAPTAIRAFMRWGTELAEEARPLIAAAAGIGRRADQPRSVDLVSPQHRRRAVSGSGYLVADGNRRDHRSRRCPGSRPRSQDRRPGRFPGISAEVLTDKGDHVDGWRRPARADAAVAVDAARDLRRPRALRETGTWSRWTNDIYFTGDGAKRDADGYFWLLGRVDDVINVAGHRIGTMEVESALVDHPEGRRGRGRRAAARDQGSGDLGVRHREGGRAAFRDARRGAQAARSPEDRRHRAPGRHPVLRRSAQDPIRQDHAAAAAGTSPKAKRSAIPRRSPTPRWSRG